MPFERPAKLFCPPGTACSLLLFCIYNKKSIFPNKSHPISSQQKRIWLWKSTTDVFVWRLAEPLIKVRRNMQRKQIIGFVQFHFRVSTWQLSLLYLQQILQRKMQRKKKENYFFRFEKLHYVHLRVVNCVWLAVQCWACSGKWGVGFTTVKLQPDSSTINSGQKLRKNQGQSEVVSLCRKK